MLILPIKKKWFDMIVSGEKKEEYRSITPYYKSRLKNLSENRIRLRNGYGANRPSIIIEFELTKGVGKTQWGAEKGVCYYVLKIKGVTK